MSRPHKTTISLDASNLDEHCAFYADLLGFRVINTENDGLITEARTLESNDYPAIRLRFRFCGPRPPIGSAIGTIRMLEFEVDDPAAVAARIEHPIWISPPPTDADAPPQRLILQDLTGYHVALVRRQEDSACAGANHS